MVFKSYKFVCLIRIAVTLKLFNLLFGIDSLHLIEKVVIDTSGKKFVGSLLLREPSQNLRMQNTIFAFRLLPNPTNERRLAI